VLHGNLLPAGSLRSSLPLSGWLHSGLLDSGLLDSGMTED